ncbi:MAG TPA: metallophosphoesterase family protein [Acidobacteriaceae bacterium]|nr:metallophosphoesterase family protein [Acidobacteriaceae bacterium]
MLFRPAALEQMAARSKAPPALWDAIREIAAATRAALGEERLAWLSDLGESTIDGNVVVLHASPTNCWQAPVIEASEEELVATYDLGFEIVIFGHTHMPGYGD